jgi:septum formation protein
MICQRGASPTASNNRGAVTPAREYPLVLASASPRRANLLAQAGILPQRIVAPEVDETPQKGELPRVYALRIATAKARNIASLEREVFVLASDTVVTLGRRILPKAETAQIVEQCLLLLSGRRHQVITAIALISPEGKLRLRALATRVAFKRLTAAEVAGYIASEEGIGKAGGYAIQGRAESFVRFINGSYSNVVGLPLCETLALLHGSGCRANEAVRHHEEPLSVANARVQSARRQ